MRQCISKFWLIYYVYCSSFISIINVLYGVDKYLCIETELALHLNVEYGCFNEMYSHDIVIRCYIHRYWYRSCIVSYVYSFLSSVLRNKLGHTPQNFYTSLLGLAWGRWIITICLVQSKYDVIVIIEGNWPYSHEIAIWYILLKSKSCHDTNCLSLLVPAAVIKLTLGTINDEQVGVITSLGFQLCSLYKVFVIQNHLHILVEFIILIEARLTGETPDMPVCRVPLFPMASLPIPDYYLSIRCECL